MSKVSMMFIFAVLAFGIFANGNPRSKATGDFHHLQLVLTWPGTFCKEQNVCCVTPVPENFVVHGLWPANSSGYSLHDCEWRPDINSTLDEYASQLAKSWPSIRRDIPNRTFWDYELEKHGTCAFPTMSVSQYLNVIINRQKEFNLSEALERDNIKPDGNPYERSHVYRAIGQAIGDKKFYISCKYQKFIFEIYICLDKMGHEVVDCPSSHIARNCPKKYFNFPKPSEAECLPNKPSEAEYSCKAYMSMRIWIVIVLVIVKLY